MKIHVITVVLHGANKNCGRPLLFSSNKFQMLVEIMESEDDTTQVEESGNYRLLLISADQYIGR